MGKRMIIVESPAKAKTINKIMGSEYIVKASMGHVRDLPVKRLGVDIDKGFKPQYAIIKGREKVIKELIEAAEKCDAVYLAPDPDREGEAIAWHLAAVLSKSIPEEKIFRVSYNEITPRAIRKAFEKPEKIDTHRVDAQQARRIVDRIVGYKVSPLLWSRVKSGLSAGRVQSVALRLVCEREQAIQAFVPEAYWVFGAKVRKLKDPRDPFEIRLVKIDDEKAEIKDEATAARIKTELENRKLVVSEIKTREIQKKAPPPFITSTLQQAGSRFHGYSPQRTMRIAQELYEGVDLGEGGVGLITYMRTDSVRLATDAIEACRALINERYGAEYVPEKPNRYRSRSGAQEAHEAIRPTDPARHPDDLKSILGKDAHRLYKIIWERFVACQMAPAKIEQRSVDIDAISVSGDGSRYLFRATASEVLFPGYMRVAGVEARKEGGDDEEADEAESLPPMQEQEALECMEWLSEQKETQPPKRFSEASLVRALEENGVGRPSTYAQILSTLTTRSYVSKEKRTLIPTDLGMQVNTFLVASLDKLFEVSFTAKLEEGLDNIERGKVEWTQMLDEFYQQFEGWLEKAKGPPADPAKVRAILESVEQVTEWRPGVKRGKRTYSDESFVTSIQKQLDDDKRPFTDRQLNAVAELAMRYHEQIPNIRERLIELDLEEVATGDAAKPPEETTFRKLELFANVTFAEPVTRGKRTYDDSEFVASLKSWVESGRRLSDAQRSALNRIVIKYASQIPDFDKIKDALDLVEPDAADDDVSGPLLEVMSRITTWKEPVTRGKRIFDDKAFFESLNEQFGVKGGLSPRQQAALKRMVTKYREQIPGFEDLAQRFELKIPKSKKAAKGGSETTESS